MGYLTIENKTYENFRNVKNEQLISIMITFFFIKGANYEQSNERGSEI